MTDPSLASVEQFAEHLRDHVRGGGNIYPFAVGMISGVVTSFHRVDAQKLDDVRDILTALSQVTNEIMTSPAHDSEVTQPLAERPLVGDGGVWAVPVAGGLVEVDPPEGFVPASAPYATFAEQRAAYEREEAMRLPRCPNCRGAITPTEPCR
jgi:hypothetical protein